MRQLKEISMRVTRHKILISFLSSLDWDFVSLLAFWIWKQQINLNILLLPFKEIILLFKSGSRFLVLLFFLDKELVNAKHIFFRCCESVFLHGQICELE